MTLLGSGSTGQDKCVCVCVCVCVTILEVLGDEYTLISLTWHEICTKMLGRGQSLESMHYELSLSNFATAVQTIVAKHTTLNQPQLIFGLEPSNYSCK